MKIIEICPRCIQKFVFRMLIIFRLGTVDMSLSIFTELIAQFTNQASKKRKAGQDRLQFIGAIMGPSTLELFENALDLHLPADKQLSECLISTTSYGRIDQALNQIKRKALKCFNYIIDNIVNLTPGKGPSENSFYIYAITTGVDRVLKTLFAICETPSFDLSDALTVSL